ncbi:MAG TPA: glycosyltransferase, partial [Candidatus Dormibacteraeota bacterium]|nr:glycosyltransferase [Candidatus Dormibacteraeota bacterium]
LAVAWVRHQPRTAALAAALGGEAAFVASRLPGRPATAPLRYVSAAARTWRMLERRRPSAVLAVAPPVVAPAVAALWCELRGRPLVVDCHTGTFHARRWAWARPLYRRLLRRCRAVLVHTDEALALVRGWGAPGLLLPDDLPQAPAGPAPAPATATVLVAGSLDENEPVAETLAAAALAPEVAFRVTGDPGRLPATLPRSAPENVAFTGFLPQPAFLAEMRDAAAVAAFSTDPHIMNRAAFEAVGLGRPLVLSDLPGLRERFGRAALFAPNRPDAMAAAVRRALASGDELAARSRALAADLRRQHAAALDRLRAALSEPDGAPRTRVLRITQHPFPADSIVRRDVLDLAACGFDVDVVCAAGPDAELPPGRGSVRVHRIPIRHRRGGAAGYAVEYAAFFVAALVVASGLGLRHRYAAVQADNLPDILAFAGVVPRLRGARIVLTLYELTPEMVAARFGGRTGRLLTMAARLVEAAAVRWADHVIVVSRPCLDVLAGRGLPAGRASIVPNTTPWLAGRPASAPGRAGSWTLVTHGTLVERYGVDVAIRALALLAERWPELTLRVVGDGEQRPALAALARAAGVGDRVAFTGPLPWASALAEVSRARLGLVPVLADGYGELLLPTKLLEYAWLGVPAVCSRLPAMEAYFPPDAVAYARPGDAEDLAARIDALLREPEAAEARARRASEIARGLAWERVRGDYLAALGLPFEEAGP